MCAYRRVTRVVLMSLLLVIALGAPPAFGAVMLADSYPESNANVVNGINSSYPMIGQSFTAIGGTLDSATFYLHREEDTAGTVDAVLYAHSGTFGTDGIPSGAPLATSSPIDVSTIGSDAMGMITFDFDNTVCLTSGQNYVILVRYDDSATESVWLGADNTTPSHPGNLVYHDSLAWRSYSTHDASFYVYVTPPPPFPVYRFYNAALGTHFYTASEDEKNNVEAALSHIFTLEGEAYRLNPATNATPLHRFYRPATGTHFYTANAAEKVNVEATLSHIYTYEGPAYNVSADDGGGAKPTVWRFYNRVNGTHFYTADAAERDSVIASLSHIYTLDGPAFFLGQ